MNDPADQKASDEAIKRNTNLTPTGVRQALDATASDFQRRIDAQQVAAPVVSTTRQPPSITVSETKLDGQPISLPAENDNQNPFPKSTSAGGGVSAMFTVCVSDGGSPPVLTQMTATFTNGILTSVA